MLQVEVDRGVHIKPFCFEYFLIELFLQLIEDEKDKMRSLNFPFEGHHFFMS